MLDIRWEGIPKNDSGKSARDCFLSDLPRACINSTDDDERVGVIGYGGLLRAFSFAHSIRGSGHVQGIYPQTCPDGRRIGFRYAI